MKKRFWAKVAKSDGCWLWTGAHQSLGYGHFWLNGRMVLAHRVAYELTRGEIQDGLTLDHLCKTRDCVNPDHLEAVTLAENIQRSGGPTANNARKTHCCNGHPYAPENTMISGGNRICRICRLIRSQARTLSKGGKLRLVKRSSPLYPLAAQFGVLNLES